MKSSINRLLAGIFLSLFVTGFGFSDEIVHVIKQGETIYSIARSYGLSADEVLKYNKISDPSKVPAGAKIRIPGTETKGASAGAATAPVKTEPSQNGFAEYRVEKNDTLYSLARRYGISLAELLNLNGFSSSYVLKAGEKIKIPSLAASQTPVQNGTQNTAGQTTTASTGNSGTAVTTIKIDPAVKWPIKAKEIAQISGKLNGVQITGDRQESVKSLTAGTVVSAGPYRGFGRVAIVQTATGYLYVYGGCETLSVKEGDKVASGAELGKLGIDTKTAKSQLFFFVYKGNTAIDPAKAPRA